MTFKKEIPKQVRDDRYAERDDRYADLLDYNWTRDSLPNRMPMSQRAKIFLPFAALTGFDEALNKTLENEIAEMEEHNGEGTQEFE